ncbi:MAG: VTT domain-containing protein [Akkermansiaceae bacterium]|jgi:uncharacterized membrane protein YdjX (TVP38/TMEM64 family)|nr:VTT domain-containing protein [Akkermansiaceae bacterium]MDP4721203.1 VTT domain-containing protein [Akkermansiaceae bacterium]MDP4778851.1 VTT domain-containing protein [Akkermansiaceae bacterium]MDP4846948.1 VTT domain-containing protein [Akkermansiaceae bacterium]MDP4897914.1 VTT domain-containing protein [Akkermansiaceae bacterium]
MKTLVRLLRDRRVQLLVFAGAFLGSIFLLWAWRSGIRPDDLKGWWKELEVFLGDSPIWLFAALVVLPGLPVPSSALLFLAGIVWRDKPGSACGLAVIAMAMNLSWTYWLAAGMGRGLVVRLAGVFGVKIPEPAVSGHLRTLLVLKLTPGIPLFLQNYLCGFLRIPFRLYLPISMLCNGLVAVGLVLSGVGLGDGKIVPALTGVGLIVLGVLATQWVRGWMRVKAEMRKS